MEYTQLYFRVLYAIIYSFQKENLMLHKLKKSKYSWSGGPEKCLFDLLNGNIFSFPASKTYLPYVCT